MRRRVLRWLLLVLIVLLSNPVRRYPVTSGVDASWAYGINDAHARGLIFGRDVLFTYGPLAWLAAPMDVGRNLAPAIAFQHRCEPTADPALIELHIRIGAKRAEYGLAFLLA